MSTFKIRNGRDIRLKGVANKEIKQQLLPKTVAIQPTDFKGIKPRLLVKENDFVKVGSPVLTDKNHPEIKIASPVSGRVSSIVRGEKRFLLQILIEPDGKQDSIVFKSFKENETQKIDRKDVVTQLLDGGLWPVIRQRPFSKLANPKDTPKSIFIHAMTTEPLALDIDYILNNKEKEFQTGLDILRRLTKGNVHLCFDEKATSKALREAKNVQIHQFAGAHPTGNVSTHIHYVDPIQKGEIVWYIEAQDVLRIAALFLKGSYTAERVVAVTGEGAKNRYYARTWAGVPLTSLLEGSSLDGMRCISGSVLNGKEVGEKGFLRFYDSQVTVIPAGGKREFLGWMSPGFNKFTFSRAYASAFLPERQEVCLNTDNNGSHRAIVLNHVYDDLVAMDIKPFFLLRAVLSRDIEEAERFGILECDEEDFALCTFACPSKTDVGGIIAEGLDLIEKEG